MGRRGLRWLAPGSGFALGVLLTRHAWGSLAPSGDDTMAVIVRANEGLRLLGHGALDGWSPRDGLGYPRFLHYGHGLALAVGILKLATVGLLSTTAVVSWLYVLSFAAIAPATWFLARSLGMSQRASALSGILALGVNSPYGVGLAGLYTSGLLPHALAAPFVFVGLGAAVRIVREPTQKHWAVVLAAAIAIVTVTHSISTMVLVFCLAGLVIFTAASLRDREGLRTSLASLAVAGIAGIGLSAFWLLPAAATLSERGEIATWQTPSLSTRLDQIINGQFVFGHYVVVFVIAGWAWALLAWRRGRPLVAATPIVAMAFLVLAHWYYAHDPSSEPARLLANRGAGYAGVLAIIPLGGLIDELIPSWRRDLGAVVATLAALFILVVFPGSPGLASVAQHQPRPISPMYSVARTLRRVVPASGRFGVERDLAAEKETTGVTHPDYWLAEKSGRNLFNIYGIDQTPAANATNAILFLMYDTKGTVTNEAFTEFGVTHIVTVEPTAEQRLVATGGFDVVQRAGPLTVLSVKSPTAQPKPGGMLRVDRGSATSAVRTISSDMSKVRLKTVASEAAMATAPLGWSSGWRVRIDGHGVSTTETSLGLLSYPLPAGSHEVAIDYVPNRLGYLGLLVAIATAVWLLRWSKRAPEVRRSSSVSNPFRKHNDSRPQPFVPG